MSTVKSICGTLLVCLFLGVSSTYVRAFDQCEQSAKDKELFTAIEQGDAKRVATLLADKHVNPNAAGPVTGNWYDATATYCATPLMLAAWLGDVEIVKLLLAKKARVNVHDSSDRTIWAYAISAHGSKRIDERLRLTKLLLAAGASPNEADKWSYRETALFHAVHLALLTGDLRIVHALIAAGAQVNVKGNSILAFTTLMSQRALIAKNPDAPAPDATRVMKALLAAGAHADQQLNGRTALIYEANGARLAGALDRIKLLVAARADVNAQHAESGQTPLLSALKPFDAVLMSRGLIRDAETEFRDRVDVINFLLASGADPNKKDKTGDTALHATLDYYNIYPLNAYPVEAEKLYASIIAAGADLNARNAKGQTIIHLLTMAEPFRTEYIPHELRLHLLRLFDATNVDFNAFDNEKTTPLLAAVKYNLKPEVVRALLAAGANPNLANSQGRTPLMEAVLTTTFDDDVVKVLLAAQPAINAQDNDGATALLLACFNGRRTVSLDVVQQLIAAKADVKARNAAN